MLTDDQKEEEWALTGAAQLVGALSLKLKGHRFNSQFGRVWAAADSSLSHPSLPVFPFFSLWN